MVETKLENLDIFDTIINHYKNTPKLYDSNVWVCYEACKKEIIRLEIIGKINCEDYNKYIDYIVEKLGI